MTEFHPLPTYFYTWIEANRDSILLESSRHSNRAHRSYLFTDPIEVLQANTLSQLPELFSRLESATQKGLYASGYFTYECGFHFEASACTGKQSDDHASAPLAWFGLYADPVIFDHRTGAATGTPLPAYASPLTEDQALETTFTDPVFDLSMPLYKNRIDQIKRLIEQGDTYQVNFTTTLRMPAPQSTATLFRNIMRTQPVEFGAFLNLGTIQILSASPELFFERDGQVIRTRPMKGTMTRGLSELEDQERAQSLSADEKNRSENVMIVDLLRNDLGRICQMGSVNVDSLFEVERYPTLLQMTSTISGKLQPGLRYYDLFRALFPCGSIVGAPKLRTMQIIRELEARDRGIYTGCIGYISPHNTARFSVAIRTIVIKEKEAEMGIGSGIVYESDAYSEYDECLAKANFLTIASSNFKLIETFLWNGSFWLLDQHLVRLARSARHFGFSFDKQKIEAELLNYAAQWSSPASHRVRLLLAADGTCVITSNELHLDASTGVALTFARPRVHSKNSFLQHKTTRRELYDKELAKAQAQGFVDAIFLNEKGNITEGAIHNVVIVTQGQWRTPPLSAGVLPGVFRHMLLKENTVQEEDLSLSDILTADEVYLCNSVRGLRRVARLDSSILNEAKEPTTSDRATIRSTSQQPIP